MRSPEFDKSIFSRTLEESRIRLPEQLIDEVLKILRKHCSDDRECFKPTKLQATKGEIWDRLISLISRLGGASPTAIGITPKHLKTYAESIEKRLTASLAALKEMTYEHIYEVGVLSKEFIISNGLRPYSLPRDKPGLFYSEGHALLEKQRTNQWPELYPLDHDLITAIAALERIILCSRTFALELNKAVSGRGLNKEGKNNSDQFIYQLCRLYREYTGCPPRASYTGSSSINKGVVTGGIIDLLKAVLPYTSIDQTDTDIALQKRIQRLSKKKDFADIWQDSKK